ALVGVWLLAASGAGAAEAVIFHVAPDGNDGWSGRLAAANAGRTDGPLASLVGARDAIRRLGAGEAGKGAPVVVRVRGGTYRMAAPLVLEPQDSGSAEAPVIYEAAPGERPVFSGGRTITGFKQAGPLWEVELPDVKAGKWHFR